jgi:Protein of unknown function DUF262/HNH endonuclease
MAIHRNQVNLDALIPRADLFEITDPVIADSRAIRITDLKAGLIYDLLRKPDFQRETANWSPQQVARLIETFSKADIIPAIILWQNAGRIFVVDGAHRLSALVAWVRNDYGAGDLSQTFFRGKVPDQQRALHDQTLDLVNNLVGPWSDLEKKGTVLGLKDIQVQWINSQSATQAADAFIRINQGGTVIDNLEVRILRAKRSALSVATRIIVRGGTGHEYWKHFKDEAARERSPKLGGEIHKLLFYPTLETPIKTTDVPLAGLGYGADVIRFAFDMVALANELPVPDSTRRKATEDALSDDESGLETIKYLQKVKRTAQLILSNQKFSLGLHPALYFYTAGGAFQPASLHNAIALFLALEKRDKLLQFLRVRGKLEDLILEHPVVVKPAAHKLGSGARTRAKMVLLFERAIAILSQNPDLDKAWRKLVSEFPHLADDDKDEKDESNKGTAGASFSRGAKSAAFLSGLSTVARCNLCGGLLHRNGMVADHKEEKSKGGTSASRNARMVHPACNSNRVKINARNN